MEFRPPRDAFEYHLRLWGAQEGILTSARRLVEEYDLDPGLLDDLEDAIREGDEDARDRALARFVEALEEAKEG